MFRRITLALTMVGTAASAALPGTAAQAATARAATAPDPVIVIAGFNSPAEGAQPMASRFNAIGTKAYYTAGAPDSGAGDIAIGAQDIGVLVDQVLAETGATKVDLVGISMGGLTARQYVRFEGGDAKVDNLVTVASPNYGTSLAGLANILSCFGVVACAQMVPGSAFLNALNEPDDTYGAVTYTTFRTAWDEVVVPVDNAMLRDGAVNVRIQDQCPLRFVEHQLTALDGTVFDGVRDPIAEEPIQLNCWAL